MAVGGWWFVGGWWLVVGGGWLVVGPWLVVGGWWLVVGGWPMANGIYSMMRARFLLGSMTGPPGPMVNTIGGCTSVGNVPFRAASTTVSHNSLWESWLKAIAPQAAQT